jgi:hypothetical protein
LVVLKRKKSILLAKPIAIWDINQPITKGSQKMQHTQTECLHTLQRFEENAYSLVLKAFRAQDTQISDSKEQVLEALRRVLHISPERHQEEWDRVINDDFVRTLSENKVSLLRNLFNGNGEIVPSNVDLLKTPDESIIHVAFPSHHREMKLERPSEKKRTREFQSITENVKFVKNEPPQIVTGLQEHIDHEIVEVNEIDKQIEDCQDPTKKLALLEKRVIKLKHISRSLDILENRIDINLME